MAKLFWQNDIFEAAFREAGLDSLDELCHESLKLSGDVVTTARTRRLIRLHLPYKVPGTDGVGQPVSFYVKTQVVPTFGVPPKKWLSYFMKGTPVGREGRSLRRLADLNVKTPLLVAAGARGHFPGTMKAVIITRGLDTHMDLEAYLEQETDDQKRMVTADCARLLVKALHKRGFSLGGARYRNFLVPKIGTESIFQVALIDQPDFGRAPHRRARDLRLMSQDHGRFFSGSQKGS
ncbi:MAG: hypothetical protein ACI9D0_000960 [Bacteroidia bacterium]|jgi:hypothetical protein